MADRFDIVGMGTVAVDLIGSIEKWPMQGQKTYLSRFSAHDGGLVGTALVAAAKLGGSVAYIGKLGSSEFSKRAIESLQRERVDTSFVIHQENAEPTISFIASNSKTGDRNIFWSDENTSYPQPEEIEQTRWFEKTNVLFTDSECGQAGVEAARVARQNNIDVVVDLENIYPHIEQLLQYANHVVVSVDFACEYTKQSDIADMLKSMQSSKDQRVIITLGEQGSVVLDAENLLKIPAFKVNVVDTTGCGDVFHGAYALAVAMKDTAEDAVKFASAAAALCATKIGGREGIPTRRQLDDFMKAHS